MIRQYAALLDPGKIGLGLSAYINVRLEKQGGAPKGKAPSDISAPPSPPGPRSSPATP